MTVRTGKAAVLALACMFVSSCVSTHLRSGSPAAPTSVPPITTAGPTPGHWNAAWTRRLAPVQVTGGIRDLALVGGALVTASPQGLEALNARTGATLWRSITFDRSGVAAFAVSGQQVVVATRGGRWLSIKAPTGQVSWGSPSPPGALIPYSDELQALATSATVPVVSSDDRTIRGVDSQTGRIRWGIGRQQLYGCTPDASRLTQPGSVETKRYVSKNWLAIPVTCGTRNAVVSVDAASGRAAWRHGTVTPDDSPLSSAGDRFVGINDDGYGIFEQGTAKDSHRLIAQSPSGQVRTVLDEAEAYDFWGPLSPLATAGGRMIIPFLRHGKHYFAVMGTSGARASIVNLSEKVRKATFDGIRAYGIQQDGSIKVAATDQASPTGVRPPLKAKAFWIAAGNGSLFIATSGDLSERGQVTITSIGN
ncbi:PQQ-binding-like beta-propeller repeat protein [Actinomadura sp. NTSP31]|uniref:outer membrane protein assembly factor BamB family protein n=1 Tax=Actinomadura sp. NTSP31 TaxID=1735447 RepID=UPI0035C08DDD